MIRNNRWFGVGARAAVSGALIAYLFSRVDMSAVGDRLLLMSPAWSLFAVAILLIQIPIVTQRWRMVMAAIADTLPFGTAARLVMIGLFFNQTLPSAIGGDVVRIWKARQLGLSLGKATNSVLLDRLCALAATCLLVAACLPWLLGLFTVPSARIALIGLVAATAVGFALLLVLDLIPGPPTHWRITQAVHSLAVDTRRVLGWPATAVSTLGLSSVIVASTGTTVYLISRALDVPLDLTHAIVLTPLVLLMTMIPISLAGWGVREMSMVTVLGVVGVSSADALAVSLVFGLAVMAVGLPGGLVWLQDQRPEKRSATQSVDPMAERLR